MTTVAAAVATRLGTQAGRPPAPRGLPIKAAQSKRAAPFFVVI